MQPRRQGKDMRGRRWWALLLVSAFLFWGAQRISQRDPREKLLPAEAEPKLMVNVDWVLIGYWWSYCSFGRVLLVMLTLNITGAFPLNVNNFFVFSPIPSNWSTVTHSHSLSREDEWSLSLFLFVSISFLFKLLFIYPPSLSMSLSRSPSVYLSVMLCPFSLLFIPLCATLFFAFLFPSLYPSSPVYLVPFVCTFILMFFFAFMSLDAFLCMPSSFAFFSIIPFLFSFLTTLLICFLIPLRFMHALFFTCVDSLSHVLHFSLSPYLRFSLSNSWGQRVLSHWGWCPKLFEE